VPRPRINPAFPVDAASLAAAHERLRSRTGPLERPLVVIGGWRSPRFSARAAERVLRRLTGAPAEQFLAISHAAHSDPARICDTVARAISSRFPDALADAARGIDVVGISMGGLVARRLASPTWCGTGNHPPLNIRRLFTLSTPHQGALLARWIRPDRAASCMRPGSAYLAALDQELPRAAYELHCYAHLHDWWVGTSNTSPQGRELNWVDTGSWLDTLLSHFTINRDERVLTDVALRLRGLEPLAKK
jgi:pimeloyl-ACP methyl ester carboxylesterase